ncbi:MAG: efflux RND transporter periplasmic adaptor subunit, partial [Eubacteriales bacterium]|nr:efflux RND transporter periplasmic adaptor subunit [Eubacteriales bacterium]
TAEEALTAAKEAADKDPDDTAAQAAFAAAQASANAAKAERDTAQAQVQATSAELAVAKQGLSTAQAAVNSIDSGKTQLKSGIDQLETSQSTIEDSISTAEQSYAITQNEIYPQTDATYAAQLEQAAVGIDSARLQLDYCKVTSPIGGVVEAVNVEADGMAAAGNAAYIISNKDSMTVTFGVTEAARDALNVGDHVTVDRNGATYDGIVTEIGTMAGVQTKLFEVKASVAGAGDALPSGVSVKVSATTEREEGKLLVPFDAIYFSGGDAYVYCVEDGMLVRTSVTVGLMDDTQAVIEEGLTEDSLVVGNWSSRLRNGAEAEIVSVNGESAEPSGTGDAQETESGSEETSDAQSGEGAEE